MRGALASPFICGTLILSLVFLVSISFFPIAQAQVSTGTLRIQTPFPSASGIVTLNGNAVTTDFAGEVRQTVTAGQTVTFSVAKELSVSSITPGVASGEKRVFSRWSDLNTNNFRSVVISSNPNMTFVANYNTAYFLQITSEFGAPKGAGWQVAGSTVTISVDSPISEANGIRKAFSRWEGDLTSSVNPADFLMNTPKLIKAIWSDQFEVLIQTQHGFPKGEGWYDSGATVNLNVESIIMGEKGKRFVFVRWTGALESSEPSIDIQVNQAMTFKIDWQAQFLVSAASTYGKIEGADWYDTNANVTLSITPIVYPAKINGTRFVFDSWDGSSSSSDPKILFMVDQPKEFVAQWKNQYLTNFSFSNAYGNISVVPTELEILALTAGVDELSINFQNSTLWLDRGSEWRLVSAKWNKAEVSPANKTAIRFSVTNPSVVLGNLSIFNARFSVVDSIGLPIEGAVARITLANGTEVERVTDKYGSADLKLIPLGTFQGSATNLAQRGIIHASEMGSNIVRTTIPVSIPVLFAAIVGVIVGVRFGLITLGWLHGGGLSFRRSRIDSESRFCRFCGVGLMKHVKICPSCHQDLHYVEGKKKVKSSQDGEQA